jgi:hypothetical protein
MPILNFANRINHVKPLWQQIADGLNPQKNALSGYVDFSAADADLLLYKPFDWTINSIGLSFINATARNFSIKIINGTNVVKDRNDYLWFRGVGTNFATFAKKVVLNPGFYRDGDALAQELEARLDAAFLDDAITFTVAYVKATGIFTITPSAHNILYMQVNPKKTMSHRDSIGGHLFGFTSDKAAAASISSDTGVFGLGTEVAIVSQTASIVTSVLNTDKINLSLDQGILINNSVAATAMEYVINYQY